MVVVVGRDLFAEIANALLQLVLVDDDPTDVRVVHVVCGLRAQPEEAPGTGRDPDAMIDTVTDDPDRLVAATTGVRPAARGTPASASASCRSFDRSGRAAGTAPRPRPARRPHRAPDRRRTPHVATVGPRGGRRRARSRPRSRRRQSGPGPGSCERDRRRGAGGRPRRRARAGRRHARPGRRRAARSRAVAARDGEHPLDRRDRRRRGAEPAAGRPGARARRAAPRARRRLRGRVGGERVEQLVVVAQQLGLAGEHLDEIALGAALELRHDLTPQPHASVVQLVVHRIVHRRETQARAELVRVAPAQLEQRPAHVTRGAAGMPASPAAAAAQHVQQHGLGLVVTRVPDEDRLRADLGSDPFERGVPRVAGSGFEVGAGVDIDRLDARAAPRRAAAARTAAASCAVPARRPWSTYTAIDVESVRRTPARATRASRRRRCSRRRRARRREIVERDEPASHGPADAT